MNKPGAAVLTGDLIYKITQNPLPPTVSAVSMNAFRHNKKHLRAKNRASRATAL